MIILKSKGLETLKGKNENAHYPNKSFSFYLKMLYYD